MAEPPIEPIPPPPDPPKNGGNGDTGRIDRDMTPLGGAQKVNYGAFGVLVALGLLFVLWWTGAFSTEPTEPEEPPQPLITRAPPPLPTPSPLPVDQPTPSPRPARSPAPFFRSWNALKIPPAPPLPTPRIPPPLSKNLILL